MIEVVWRLAGPDSTIHQQLAELQLGAVLPGGIPRRPGPFTPTADGEAIANQFSAAGRPPRFGPGAQRGDRPGGGRPNR